MSQMKNNNCTIFELENKLKDIIEKIPFKALEKKDLDQNDLYFQMIDHGVFGEYLLYFLCTDGIGMMSVNRDGGKGVFYKEGKITLGKLDEKKLYEVAKRQAYLKEQLENANAVLEENKLRGLFAKLKASK